LPPSVSHEARLVTSRAKSPFVQIEHRPFSREPRVKNDRGDHVNHLYFTDGTADEVKETTVLEDVKEEASQDYEESDDNKDETIAVSKRIAQGVKIVRRPRTTTLPESKPMPFFLRLLLALIALATSAAVVNFKTESASIGYCDTGSSTSSALEEAKAKWNAIEECNKENRTLLYLSSLSRHLPGMNGGEAEDENVAPCPPLPLSPLPHPATCTPCPDHATCAQHTVTCNTGHLLRPHPLLFFLPAPPNSLQESSLVPLKFSSPSDIIWKAVSVAMDGLPGLGPVAFPPWCMEDPKRKRNIGALGKAVEAILGQERGKRLCAGEDGGWVIPDSEGGEARKWGVEVEKLKEALMRKTSV
jgi:hypothetical protein